MAQKCPPCVQKVPEYMSTYGDFITLLLCFFIAIYQPPTPVKVSEMRIMLSPFQGSRGIMPGGNTLSKQKLEDMGLTVESMPAEVKGKVQSKEKFQVKQIFEDEIKKKKIKITEEERGIVISLIGDGYFAPGSAKLMRAGVTAHTGNDPSRGAASLHRPHRSATQGSARTPCGAQMQHHIAPCCLR